MDIDSLSGDSDTVSADTSSSITSSAIDDVHRSKEGSIVLHEIVPGHVAEIDNQSQDEPDGSALGPEQKQVESADAAEPIGAAMEAEETQPQVASTEVRDATTPGLEDVQQKPESSDQGLLILTQEMERKKLESRLLDAEIEKKQLALQLYEAKLEEKQRDERVRMLEAEVNELESKLLMSKPADEASNAVQRSSIKPSSSAGISYDEKTVRFDFGQRGSVNEAFLESSSDSESSNDDTLAETVEDKPAQQQQLLYYPAATVEQPRPDYYFTNGGYNPDNIVEYPDYSDSD